MSQPGIVFGAAGFGIYAGSVFDSGNKAQHIINVLKAHNVYHIDTSRLYPTVAPGTSEQVLGQTQLSGFTIDTKVLSTPGEHKPEKLLESINKSLQTIGISKVNTLYLHFPDPETPLEEVCRGMNEIHKKGLFETFGISNFTIFQINEMLEICERNNFVKPSVYQGAYNALTRNVETDLFPLLRKHNITFYAYSAAAGGVLSGNSSRLADSGAPGKLFRAQYGSERATEAIQKVAVAAEQHNIKGHAIALRWILHHSALDAARGDAIVIGARTTEQLEETLEACESGPLPQEVVELVEDAWQTIKDEAPPYTLWEKKEGETETAIDKYLKSLKRE